MSKTKVMFEFESAFINEIISTITSGRYVKKFKLV
jgi:hypothetical protein